jgi:transposase
VIKESSSEIQVSLDIGSIKHAVAIGLSNGKVIEQFMISHNKEGFKIFFDKIEALEMKLKLPVIIAMEGYNGYARPLDSMILAREYRLFSINSMKLARFREIFAGPAKTDELDALLGLQLLQAKDFKALDKGVIQEIGVVPEENRILKRLTRFRKKFVREKTRAIAALHGELLALCPGLLEITTAIDNIWFLNLLSYKEDITKLANVRKKSLLKINGIGEKTVEKIIEWQTKAHFSDEIEWVSELIVDEAKRIIELKNKIGKLDAKISSYAAKSEDAKLLQSIPGFGPICSAEIAGEIGTIERFSKESGLSLYIGMSTLDNSSGKYKGGKQPKHVNTRAKAAMMIAVDRHRKYVVESQTYYEKKRQEGKKHNQAIRSLGRHLTRVIFKMLKEKRA